jgi:RHS repeat-associated protein
MTSINNGCPSTTCYTYDANGRRVRKIASGTTTEYIYDAAGSVVGEKVGSTWTKGYVYLGGQLLAQYDNTVTPNTTYFAHQDHLGSTRVLTKVDRSVQDALDYLPYGEQIAGDTGTTHKFTGHERDAESGLDDTLYRKYASGYGRWLSPDPLGGEPGEPQSWNRYSYVTNDPLNFSDPDGAEKKCALDGINIACSDASDLIERGAAYPCPDNDCFGTRQNGNKIEKWLPPTWFHEPATGQQGGTMKTSVGLQDGQWVQVGTTDYCQSTTCLGLLHGFGNFAAGATDVFSFGFTAVSRQGTYYEQIVQEDSVGYAAGAVTGAVITSVVAPAAAGPKSALAQTRFARWMNTGKTRLGWQRFRGNPTFRLAYKQAHLDLHPRPALEAVRAFASQLK